MRSKWLAADEQTRLEYLDRFKQACDKYLQTIRNQHLSNVHDNSIPPSLTSISHVDSRSAELSDIVEFRSFDQNQTRPFDVSRLADQTRASQLLQKKLQNYLYHIQKYSSARTIE